ncbi:MAG: hypothetical protein ACE14M_05095 [Terriglobales bacterium]
MTKRNKTPFRKSAQLDTKAFVAARLKGESIEKSLLASGATPATAKRGMASVNLDMRRELATERKRRLVEAAELSRAIPDGEARDAIRGIILEDAAARNSKGTPATKLAAQMKGVELIAEANNPNLGIVILELPHVTGPAPVLEMEDIWLSPGPDDPSTALPPAETERQRRSRRYAELIERRGCTFALDPVERAKGLNQEEYAELEQLERERASRRDAILSR